RVRSRLPMTSPAEPSHRSTSTCRARRTSTSRKNSHWPSPKTDDGAVKRFGCSTLILLGLVALLAAGCVRTDEGVSIRGENADASATAHAPTTRSTDDSGPAAPGV